MKSHQGMCLVELLEPEKYTNGKTKKAICNLTLFNSNQITEALEALATSERKNHQISVLLSSADTRILKKAYPNYFGSTNQFTQFIKQQLQMLEYATW